ncbi:hypothetical protein F5B20DRAFT_531755 [Whalleya microplaca]|nr:hypothetical protein F5B20DRAFT_531755 [Whalleya microplaca]
MRSHPYTHPPPLPPLLTELSTYLPNHRAQNGSRRYSDDDSGRAIPLADLDPETSHLLPRKRRQHRVRIQGKLALVRSVSVVNLRQSANASSPPPLPDCAVGRRRPRSSDESRGGEDGEFEERDTQFRGYGIGGAGNIRRPTEVMGASRTSSSLSSLFSSSSLAPNSPALGFSPDRKRWGISELWGRIGDRKGKGKAKGGT